MPCRFQATLNFAHPIFGTTRTEREEAVASIAHTCLKEAGKKRAEGPIYADDGVQIGIFRVSKFRKSKPSSLDNLMALQDANTGRLVPMILKDPEQAWRDVLAERKAIADAPALEQARHERASEAARRGHANRRAKLDAKVALKAGIK